MNGHLIFHVLALSHITYASFPLLRKIACWWQIPMVDYLLVDLIDEHCLIQVISV
jgi:hypothetical protein